MSPSVCVCVCVCVCKRGGSGGGEEGQEVGESGMQHRSDVALNTWAPVLLRRVSSKSNIGEVLTRRRKGR